MSALDDALLPAFASQHWLVTHEQVLAAGGTRHTIAHRLATGRWEIAEPRVYRLAGFPVTWQTSLLAPILCAGGASMASHHSAAVLHQVPGFGRGVPVLTIERGTKLRRRPAAIVHTSTDLDRCSTRTIDGIPTTDFNRTILDLARTTGEKRLLRAIEFGRRTGLTTWSDLIRTHRHHARRGRPGIRRLRAVILANAHREEITDSDFELLAIALLVENGLPEPVLHHRVYDGDRFIAEVDLAYPDLKIAIELDGRIHLEEAVRERDLPRQNDLVLAGWTVLRFTWDRMHLHPQSLVAEVRAARAAAAVAA